MRYAFVLSLIQLNKRTPAASVVYAKEWDGEKQSHELWAQPFQNKANVVHLEELVLNMIKTIAQRLSHDYY